MTPMWYTAVKPFKAEGEAWLKYLAWLGRTDLERVVTLDSLICPYVYEPESAEDWRWAVQEDFIFTNQIIR
jgi:hypothetical protein